MPKLIRDVVALGTVAAMQQPTLPIDDELTLRPFRDDDVDAVVAAFATPDIQYFHFRQLDHDEAKHWIKDCRTAWKAERAATWAVSSGADDRVAGRVTVYLSLADGRGEISYWVLPEARQRRVATRACVAATQWAHALGLHRVILQHAVVNTASARVARSAGFRQEGVQRAASVLADGRHDVVLWSHLSTDEP